MRLPLTVALGNHSRVVLRTPPPPRPELRSSEGWYVLLRSEDPVDRGSGDLGEGVDLVDVDAGGMCGEDELVAGVDDSFPLAQGSFGAFFRCRAFTAFCHAPDDTCSV